jgi:hypothetical protein
MDPSMKNGIDLRIAGDLHGIARVLGIEVHFQVEDESFLPGACFSTMVDAAAKAFRNFQKLRLDRVGCDHRFARFLDLAE